MHEREFEKKVQQQMQELRLPPGSDVWARVQEDLRKKKRRRPVIIWLLFAGLLLGGSAWLLYGRQDNKNVQPTAAIKPAANKPSADNPAGTAIPPTDPSSTATATTTTTTTTSPVITDVSTTATAPKGTASSEIRPSPIAKRKTYIIQQKTNPVTKKKDQITDRTDENNKALITTKPQDELERTADVADAVSALRHANVSNELLRQPAYVDISRVPPVNLASHETHPSVTRRHQQSKWQWGVQAGAGISDLGTELFQGSSVADFAYSGGSVTGSPVTVPRASAVNTGAAFHIGGYISKSIGRKFRAKAGLNYEYYSNRITVGDHVPASRVVNQGPGNTSMVDEYYKALGNNKYTNRYQFASLPVSIQWQISNHAKRNLVWENGVAYSRMFHTNALIYDGVGGAYYKDNSVFRKNQWTVSTSLMFSIKTKNNMQFFAGPHLQYGLSSLVTNDEKHMRYAGLKLAVGFNKK